MNTKIDETRFLVRSKALELAVQSRVFPEYIMEYAKNFYEFLIRDTEEKPEGTLDK